MLMRTASTFLPAQTIAAQLERDEPGGAHARLGGLAHLMDSLGPQLDLHMHSMWPAGSTATTAPELLFLPGLHARQPRKTQGKVSLTSYRGIPTTLTTNEQRARIRVHVLR